LWPDIEKAKAFSPDEELIKVRTKAEDVHKAGTKWRCRWFQVVGKVKPYQKKFSRKDKENV
jgi:hypothetical protein